MPNRSLWSLTPAFTRRAFLTAVAAGLAASRRVLARPAGKLPVTGTPEPSLAPFDRLMTSFVEEHDVPGAALAVTRNGRLVYARGFGHADLGTKETVARDALFRIASVSKPFTAVAVLRLVERGKLGLDDRVTDRMTLKPARASGGRPDPRWREVTVRQCLQHTGGWDRDRSFDPIGRPWEIARDLGVPPPPGPSAIVRYMLGRPLDFDPGERYAYSNLGYLVLARVIEAVTGQPYEVHVRKAVLAPLGITRMRLARALPADRPKKEVSYYDGRKQTGRCLYPPAQGRTVPLPDGAINVEAYEAHGGWVASPVDLVRFAAAFDVPARCPLLKPRTIQTMWARPGGAAGAEPDGKPKPAYYGCGWMVRPAGPAGKANTWHTGLIPGSESLLVRRRDGLNWAVLFNTDRLRERDKLAGLIDPLVHQAADEVRRWPTGDQFGGFVK